MSNKFRTKVSSLVNRIEYNIVCIGCGKVERVSRPSFMPAPNPTTNEKSTRLKCLLGKHVMYPEDELELNVPLNPSHVEAIGLPYPDEDESKPDISKMRKL